VQPEHGCLRTLTLPRVARLVPRPPRMNEERAVWTEPDFEEIKMDAEIGAYQEDEPPPFAQPEDAGG
jgi:hypothetical protein